MQADSPRPAPGRFVSGSVLRHVVVMSATGSVGLMAIFVVDLLSLLYVSKLGDPRLTAGVGFASIVQFAAVAVNIGLMIAAGAVVSRAVGEGDAPGARRLATSAAVHGALVSAALAAAMWPAAPWLLRAIGAEGESLEVATRFLRIALPSNVLLGLGMLFSGLLRAVGEARLAMFVTLAGAAVTAVFDPLLIFGAGLGVDGAAITLCLARCGLVAVGWRGVSRAGLLQRPRAAPVLADAPLLLRIALPAILTNLAPSAASAFLARVLSGYGPAIVAGNSVIDRLTPVAFGGLFALSGAIGPILGQNWGAGRYDRMRAILRAGIGVTAVYTALVWAALAAARGPLAAFFTLTGPAEELFVFFCLVGGGIWFFNGLLFLGNASFNNLGFPLRSTALNWGRATLGTVPPALVGAHLYGPPGVIAAVGAGSLVFGVAGIVLALRTVGVLEARAPAGAEGSRRAEAEAALAAGPAHTGAVS